MQATLSGLWHISHGMFSKVETEDFWFGGHINNDAGQGREAEQGLQSGRTHRGHEEGCAAFGEVDKNDWNSERRMTAHEKRREATVYTSNAQQAQPL